MTGKARAFLLRLPRPWRRAINRASLPKLGLPRSAFAVTITKNQWNDDSFDLAKDILPEAREAMRYQDEATFGDPRLWEPWSTLRGHRGVTWEANEHRTGTLSGMVEFVFTREPIKASPPYWYEGKEEIQGTLFSIIPVRFYNHIAAFIVNHWGLL